MRGPAVIGKRERMIKWNKKPSKGGLDNGKRIVFESGVGYGICIRYGDCPPVAANGPIQGARGHRFGFSMSIFNIGGTLAFSVGPIFIAYFVRSYGLEASPYTMIIGLWHLNIIGIRDFTLSLQKSRMLQIQGVKGEAVVIYREPLRTKEMRYPRLSRRVKKTRQTLRTISNSQIV